MNEKGEDTKEVFSRLEKFLGSEAEAYSELGAIASKLFNNHRAICDSYIRKSLDLEPDNLTFLDLMYRVTYDIEYQFKILKIQNEKNDHKALTESFKRINYIDSTYQIKNFEDYSALIIDSYAKCIENEVSICRDLLAFAYLKLEQLDEVKTLIQYKAIRNPYVLKSCIDKGLTHEDEALALIGADLKRCLVIANDYKKIYAVFRNHFEKKPNSLRPLDLIKVAFFAEEYDDFIEYYYHDKFKEKFANSGAALIYKLLIGYIVNRIFIKEDYIKAKTLDFDMDDRVLLSLAECYELMDNIAQSMYEWHKSGFGVIGFVTREQFENLDKLLCKQEIIQHPLHSDLLRRRQEFIDDQDKYELECLLADDSITPNLDLKNPVITSFFDCKKLYELGLYSELIKALEVWFTQNKPTVTAYQYMASAYDKINDLNNMNKYSKLAYELSQESKENNYMVAYEYLDVLEKHYPDQKDEIKKVKESYNFSVASLYRLKDVESKKFYKYCPFNINTIDALTNQYFYLPSKNQLNDPIELPKLEYPNIKNDIIDDYRVFSLSENSDSMLMWSHYAENHRGICITYKLGDFVPYGVGVSNVIYNNSAKRLVDRNDAKYRYKQHLLTKNEDWSYEKEVRIFTIHEKLYYEKFDYLDYDRNKVDAYVHSITLGCDFPEAKESLIKKLIRSINDSNPQNPDIRLIRAKIPTDNPFSLAYEDITHELTTGI